MSDEPIEIRRYPNRRLYDRSQRRYITLQDVEELVREGKTVEVRDSRTGEDLTRQVLTQLLLEGHPEKMDMIPVGMLHGLLRANDLVVEYWRWYLRQALAMLEGMQEAGPPLTSPLDWMSALMPGTRRGSRSSTVEEAETLARRLVDLERRLERLESGRNPADNPNGPSLDRLEQRMNDLEDKPPPNGRDPSKD